MFFHSIKDTQACSIEATPDAVVAITTGKMLQTSLGGTYSKKFQVKKKSLILLLLFLQPTVQMWPSLDSASHLGVSLRGGTASVTLALERKKLLITRESSGKRLGRTDPSQETHFLFIFVSYLDSGGVLGWINTAVQELWVNSERAFFSATRTNHLIHCWFWGASVKQLRWDQMCRSHRGAASGLCRLTR